MLRKNCLFKFIHASTSGAAPWRCSHIFTSAVYICKISCICSYTWLDNTFIFVSEFFFILKAVKKNVSREEFCNVCVRSGTSLPRVHRDRRIVNTHHGGSKLKDEHMIGRSCSLLLIIALKV